MRTRELPIFPLPLVLFPGAPQLLHIFEPRYRQMLDDCRRDDGRFGISFVPPTGDGDPASAPAPVSGAVGCIAGIRAVHPLPDGRSNLLTMGEERYVLRRHVQCDRLYHVALVDPFADDPSDREEMAQLARTVADQFHRFALAVGVLNDRPTPTAELPAEPPALSFHVAAVLEIDVRVKQELLESRSPAARLTRLQAILERLNTEVTHRVEVHLGARRNGSGRHAAPLGGV